MTLKQTDIEALVELFGDSSWKEMHLRMGEDELFLTKDANATSPMARGNAQPAAAPAPAQAPTPAPAPAQAATPAPAPPPADSTDRSGWIEVKAPNLGTFYRAPSPEADPNVTVGATVTEETEICLIEVMKLFTTMRAGLKGTVREIVAQDGDMVEFGATLMWIEPEA